jgi:putative ABC transport system permease protein
VDRLRGFQATTGTRRFGLAGVDFSLEGARTRFVLQSGEIGEAFRAVRERGEVLITEPLSRKTGLGLGDSLPIVTPAGERRFAIAGVAYDYSSEAGAAAMDLETMAGAFGPGPINSIALYLDDGVDPERFIDRIRARFPDQPLNLRSNRALRQEVMRIFDQTFAVTRLLQAMALLVAASGITLTLLVLARERRSELALYRALGAGRRQILRLFLGKGLAIGVFGLLLGALAGAAFAAILVLVINRAYFGWTIQVALPWRDLASAAVTILGVAALASLYPAARASTTPATDLSRDDL